MLRSSRHLVALSAMPVRQFHQGEVRELPINVRQANFQFPSLPLFKKTSF